MDLSLLILAAGMGNRYGGLKQMDTMGPNGETVLDYSVYDAIQAGFNEVIFVIRKEFEEDFKQKVSSKFEDKIKVKFAYQDLNDIPAPHALPSDRVRPWGTAHAVRSARDLITQPFVVINADDFYGRDAYLKIADFFSKNTSENHYSMVAYSLENTLSEKGGVNRGICKVDGETNALEQVIETLEIQRTPEGSLSGKIEETSIELEADQPVSLNFWGFTPTFMEAINTHFDAFIADHLHDEKAESYLPSVIDELIQKKEATCTVLKTSGNWLGVTYPDDKNQVVAALNELVTKGVYPKQLWQ